MQTSGKRVTRKNYKEESKVACGITAWEYKTDLVEAIEEGDVKGMQGQEDKVLGRKRCCKICQFNSYSGT